MLQKTTQDRQPLGAFRVRAICASIASAGAVLALGGCATQQSAQIEQGVQTRVQEAQAAASALSAGRPLVDQQEVRSVRRTNANWIPVQRVADALPAEVTALLAREVVINRSFDNVQDVAAHITRLTGAATSVAPGVPVALGSPAAGGAPGAPPTGAPGMPPGMPPGMSMGAPSFAPPGIPGMGAPTPSSQVNLVYSGSLRGFLDLVAARMNVFWRWDGRSIHFFQTETRTFRIAALPGTADMSASVDGAGGGASAAGGAASAGAGASSGELSAGITATGLSVWQSIENGVRTMLSANGRMDVSSATGTLTVSDTPQVLDRVAAFMQEQNEGLMRQVVLNVRVLNVDLNESHAYGINWNLVYQNVSRRVNIAAAAGQAAAAGSGTLAVRILSGSMFEGSSAIIEALSTQGRVSQVTSASMVTINNQPVPIQVGRSTAFLASSSRTPGTDGQPATVTLTPGAINTGFGMTMLPHILDNSRLMLQYSGSISSLLRINTVSSGDSSIQTPETESRNFLQRTVLRSGETLVVAGFEQFALDATTSGIGDARNVALGGRQGARDNRSVLVVLIQPVLLPDTGGVNRGQVLGASANTGTGVR